MSSTKDEGEPIPGPSSVGPDYAFEPDWEMPVGPMLNIGRKFADLVRKPAHWIRENVIEVNRGPKYYWYHKRFAKALPIDECYTDDYACAYEAQLEFRRNFMIDRATLDLLRYRRDGCDYWHQTDRNSFAPSEYCKDIRDTYNREETNFFIKYGDQPFHSSVVWAFNKQKHRMIMERRQAELAETEGEKEKMAPKQIIA